MLWHHSMVSENKAFPSLRLPVVLVASYFVHVLFVDAFSNDQLGFPRPAETLDSVFDVVSPIRRLFKKVVAASVRISQRVEFGTVDLEQTMPFQCVTVGMDEGT